MMLTAESVYESSVVGLPNSERLRLAALILADLSKSAAPILDFSDSWSEEDLHDLTVFAAQYAAQTHPEENDRA
jgi:hypothetical protein